MLYEFHSWQNSIEAGKVHATYIILGTRKPPAQSDGDVEMASSAPEAEYYDSEVPTQSLTLVTEERLKGVQIKSQGNSRDPTDMAQTFLPSTHPSPPLQSTAWLLTLSRQVIGPCEQGLI
jgi:DNA polymerase subunit Cdc27